VGKSRVTPYGIPTAKPVNIILQFLSFIEQQAYNQTTEMKDTDWAYFNHYYDFRW
jgi:hypothetical protein